MELPTIQVHFPLKLRSLKDREKQDYLNLHTIYNNRLEEDMQALTLHFYMNHTTMKCKRLDYYKNHKTINLLG